MKKLGNVKYVESFSFGTTQYDGFQCADGYFDAATCPGDKVAINNGEHMTIYKCTNRGSYRRANYLYEYLELIKRHIHWTARIITYQK